MSLSLKLLKYMDFFIIECGINTFQLTKKTINTPFKVNLLKHH